ncbi:unnamed protein product [Ectocarpus sp. CCAP 1310/34]|nr:unnamed protein product [Ectocarpus sp. CCAP 1310/34]
MSGRTLRPAAASSACSLVTKHNEGATDTGLPFETPKKWAPLQAPPKVIAAPVAFATDEFADFGWPGDDETKLAEKEELDDLLRLGLELGDLECVFGNTDLNCDTADDDAEEGDFENAGDGGSDRGGGWGKEPYFAGGATEELLLDTDDGGGKDGGWGKEPYLEGGATEELLLDADLQDALFDLPDLDLDRLEDKGDRGQEKHGCGSDSPKSTQVDCGAEEAATKPPPDLEVLQQMSPAPSPPAATAAAAAATGSATLAVAPAPPSPAELPRRETPGALPGENLVVAFDAVGDEHRPITVVDLTDAPAPAPAPTVDAGGVAPSDSEDNSDGKPDGANEHRESRACRMTDTVDITIIDTRAGASVSADAVAGVPTRLLDAVDLWESAANAKKKKKKAAAAAAAAARERANRSAAINKPSNTATSSSSSSSSKKKNEFGKRRRSSGGGGRTAPALEDPALLVAAPATGTSTTTGGDGGSASKVKGKGKGRATKGKKVDPLVTLRDARGMARKPLIVQWLKSDGCESDEEAEAALGKAVGSLSAISRYWGSGG